MRANTANMKPLEWRSDPLLVQRLHIAIHRHQRSHMASPFKANELLLPSLYVYLHMRMDISVYTRIYDD